MLELIVLFMILSLVTACMFSPAGNMRFFSKTQLVAGKAAIDTGIAVEKAEAPKAPAEPVSFLTYLEKEIEAELSPRPTCSIQQRHYDSLVAMEVKNRLALMAE